MELIPPYSIGRTRKESMSLLNLEGQIIDERIIRAVEEMGFEQFSPIQEQAIPEMMKGIDVIGQAQTGTGKTAAFGIPLLQSVDVSEQGIQGLVLCPTRELAIQAAEEIRKFAKYMSDVRVLPIYGGQDISKQIRSLKGNVKIVVGTPGRVMDHMRRHTLKLDHLKTVVLDEADEMLNMGFREDMETILEQIDQQHQTVLFSATMPQAILDITGHFQQNPVLIKTIKKELTVPAIRQYYYEVRKENKKDVVGRLLDYYNPKRTLIFTNTKRMADDLAEDLKGRGYFAEALHGDLSQAMRDRVMDAFRKGAADILIATDVAARGIDVDDVEAVINFDVPQDIEYYVHRIGRTGRAGKGGRAFTLVVGREIYKIRDIEKVCKTKMKPRTVPSVSDVTEARANKALKDVLAEIAKEDLTAMTRIIQEKMDEEDCTALEIAAAFLKLQMGEEPEEIKIEAYKPGKNKGGSSRNGRSYGDRDQYGKSKDRKNYGSKDGKKTYGSKDKDKDKKYGSRDKYAGGKKKSYDGKKSDQGKKHKEGNRDFYKKAAKEF